MRDVELDGLGGSGSAAVGGVAGSGGRVPEWPLVWGGRPRDDDLGPGDLGGAVDEEVFQQGGGEGHVPVLQPVEAGYGGLVGGAEGAEEGEGGGRGCGERGGVDVVQGERERVGHDDLILRFCRCISRLCCISSFGVSSSWESEWS